MKHPYPVVMGIDPGVSTGVAIATPTEDGYTYVTYTCKEVRDVWINIESPINVLVVEQFNASLIDKYGIHTVEVVGGVIALAWKHGITVVRDTPQSRRPYIAYARSLVKPRQHITVHEQRHEVDALSHAVRYLYHKGYITSLKVE